MPPHLSLEFLAKAGMFHPQLPNLAGEHLVNTMSVILVLVRVVIERVPTLTQ